MFNSKQALLASVVLLVRLTAATSPGCLLGAVNTQPQPGDLKSICGPKAHEVQEHIKEKCSDFVRDAAMEAFAKSCLNAGFELSPMDHSSSSVSASASASAESSVESSASEMSSDAYPASYKATETGSAFAPYVTEYYDESCACVRSVILSPTGGTGSSVAPGVARPTGGVAGTPPNPASPEPKIEYSSSANAVGGSFAGAIAGVALAVALAVL